MTSREKQKQTGAHGGTKLAEQSLGLGAAAHRLFSIGHSNHEFTRFLELLQAAGVTMIADVRSSPYSQWAPQYNRESLERVLRERGIDYEFLGGELGGRPRDHNLYDDDNRLDYDRVRQTAGFQTGLDKLCRCLEECSVAMLCSEEDPLDCHRGLMIAPALAERGIRPWHLRGDGAVESTENFEARLLAETNVGRGMLDGLFAQTISPDDRRQIITDAYQIQARRKAFRLRDESAG
jgi:hypothetical protein